MAPTNRWFFLSMFTPKTRFSPMGKNPESLEIIHMYAIRYPSNNVIGSIRNLLHYLIKDKYLQRTFDGYYVMTPEYARQVPITPTAKLSTDWVLELVQTGADLVEASTPADLSPDTVYAINRFSYEFPNLGNAFEEIQRILKQLHGQRKLVLEGRHYRLPVNDSERYGRPEIPGPEPVTSARTGKAQEKLVALIGPNYDKIPVVGQLQYLYVLIQAVPDATIQMPSTCKELRPNKESMQVMSKFKNRYPDCPHVFDTISALLSKLHTKGLLVREKEGYRLRGRP